MHLAMFAWIDLGLEASLDVCATTVEEFYWTQQNRLIKFGEFMLWKLNLIRA